MKEEREERGKSKRRQVERIDKEYREGGEIKEECGGLSERDKKRRKRGRDREED